LRVLRRQPCDVLRTRDRVGERVRIETAHLCGAGALAEMRLDTHRQFVDRAVGGGVAARETKVAAVAAFDLDDAGIRLRPRQQPVGERLGVVRREHHGQMSLRSVLSTLIWRNRAGTAPCDTAAACAGWPLPQKKDPPTKRVDLSPSPSIAFQKSGVRPW